MKSIWKWSLSGAVVQEIPMPMGATILTVQLQGEVPQVWALVHPELEKTLRRIAIYGTGHRLPDDPGRYISTFQMQGGALVFHAFEQR